MPYANPEERKAYNRAYYAAHREHMIASQRENVRAWATAHPESCRRKSWKHRHSTPERKQAFREYRQARWAANLEKERTSSAILSQRQRALKRNAPGNGVTREQWSIIKEEYGQRCAYCAAITKPAMDHIEPLNRGGAHDIENVAPACKACNSSKNDTPLLLWLAQRMAA